MTYIVSSGALNSTHSLQTRGPAALKALSPKLVRVRPTRSVRVSVDRSFLRRASRWRVSQQSSAR